FRDLAPTNVQGAEPRLGEASAPPYDVGASRTVNIDAVGLTLPARAVAPDRVVADVDASVERAAGGRHAAAASTVTVAQGEQRWSSDPRTPFAIDLFPHSLQHLANGWAA